MIWRIRGRSPFARLERHGVRIRSSSLWCTYLFEPDDRPPRVAFAIGRAAGTAVERNRLRRQMRTLIASLELPSGWYLFGARVPASELTFETLGLELTRLAERMRTAGST